MINEFDSLKGLQDSVKVSGASVEISQHINKEALVALSKIQIGDLVKGELLLEDEKALLQLESGLKLLAHLPNQVEINKLLEFLVVGKERQKLILQPTEKVGVESKPNIMLTDKAMQELSLKDVPEMKNLVGQFISKQLPLVREQLMQVYHLAKNYDMPMEVLTNLVSNKQGTQEKELSFFRSIKEESMATMRPIIEELLNKVGTEQYATLGKALVAYFKPSEIKDVLFKMLDSLPVSVHLDLMDELIGGSSEANKLTDSLKSLEHLLPNAIDLVKEQNELQGLLAKVLDNLPWEKSREFSRLLIEKELTVDLNGLRNNESEEIDKITDTASQLKKVLKIVEEVTGESKEKVSIPMLESTIHSLEKFNMEGQYFCFPLQVREQEASGELYFFKPKKKKSQNAQGMYIVLALNMPALKKIEVHLIEKCEQISLKLKVENDTIKKLLSQYEGTLIDCMKSEDRVISQVEIELLTEKTEKRFSEGVSDVCHLDFKV